jgi:hypothetical protein
MDKEDLSAGGTPEERTPGTKGNPADVPPTGTPESDTPGSDVDAEPLNLPPDDPEWSDIPDEREVHAQTATSGSADTEYDIDRQENIAMRDKPAFDPADEQAPESEESAAFETLEAGATSNPDPVTQKITGLEPGGGVPPDETPPGEGSMSQDQGHDE